jgi:glycine betaine/proline transport system ATP-binding protein
MLQAGHSKDEIFSECGQTVGVVDASFEIFEGEIFVIMGLSGSGKSTLVRLLNRLLEPTSGEVWIDDRNIASISQQELNQLRRTRMSMVFQSFALMPHMSVLDNTAFGLELSGMSREQRHQRALESLKQVGLEANAASYPDELSGGMQQRVGLARALAIDPDILLMDEAFSALDPLIRTEMQEELVQLQKASHRTVVFISHDLDEAMRIGDRIAIMQDGRIIQIGTPEEILQHPADDYVASFFEGVDPGTVLSAGDIASREGYAEAIMEEATAAALREEMRRREADFVHVISREGRYCGTVMASDLSSISDDDDIARVLSGRDSGLDSEAEINHIIPAVADSSYDLPVIDSKGQYLGAVSDRALLKALQRSGG